MYPPAPWTLQGHAMTLIRLMDIAAVRPFVPSELAIVPVLPGKTLGLVYGSRYESGSTLEYSELIVSAALVRLGWRLGAWISHIYVDHEKSIAGGREIWGLPKEWADFKWHEHGVEVQQQGNVLCRVESQLLSAGRSGVGLPGGWQPTLHSRVFCDRHGNLMQFDGAFRGSFRLGRSRLVVPDSSPFASLGLTQRGLTLMCENLHLVAGAPQGVSLPSE